MSTAKKIALPLAAALLTTMLSAPSFADGQTSGDKFAAYLGSLGGLLFR